MRPWSRHDRTGHRRRLFAATWRPWAREQVNLAEHHYEPHGGSVHQEVGGELAGCRLNDERDPDGEHEADSADHQRSRNQEQDGGNRFETSDEDLVWAA